jgi:hypothetical protein
MLPDSIHKQQTWDSRIISGKVRMAASKPEALGTLAVLDIGT